MRIIITGSPGTGKSSVSKLVAAKLNLEIIDLKKLAHARGLVSSNKEVDTRHLTASLKFLSKKQSFLVEGHLACEIKIPADYIFVLRCRPDILEKRLKKRGYGRAKIQENLMVEMLDYCMQRVANVYKLKPLELDTSKRTPNSSADIIVKIIKERLKKIDSVNYLTYLKKYLKVSQQ